MGNDSPDPWQNPLPSSIAGDQSLIPAASLLSRYPDGRLCAASPLWLLGLAIVNRCA